MTAAEVVAIALTVLAGSSLLASVIFLASFVIKSIKEKPAEIFLVGFVIAFVLAIVFNTTGLLFIALVN